MDPRLAGQLVLLSGNSHPKFANSISEKLSVVCANCSVVNSSNSETSVSIQTSVRCKDVYIIQTATKSVNNDMMEMMILAYACKTSCARDIIGVIPYLPYCKQSKMKKRGSVVSKLLADMISKSGFTHLITIDLHTKEIQGFYNFPIHNLRASPYLIQYVVDHIADYEQSVVVAKSPGSVQRASSFAERLGLPIAVIHGQEPIDESDIADGRNSPPPELESRVMRVTVSNVPDILPKVTHPLSIVGDVQGKIALIVSDMLDDAQSFVSAAELLLEKGSRRVYVFATHGLLSLNSPQILQDSVIHEVVVTNTIPQSHSCSKIKTVDVSGLFAEAIRRIHNRESTSYLFRNIAVDD